MKILTTKQEIAKAINVDGITAVRIDLADADEYGIKSQKVRIDNGTFSDGMKYYIHAEIRAYSDKMKFTFTSYGVCLSDRFGYEDMEEMLEYANAPIIKKDSDVVLCVVDSKRKTVFAPCILHTADHITQHCSTPLTFIDEDNDAIPYMMNADAELTKEWFNRAIDRI